jgi:hypothetical protein
MNYSVKITNEELYNEKVVDVELDFHKGGMNGDVAIEVEGEGEKCFSGEHGAHDYEEDYGFIIVSE